MLVIPAILIQGGQCVVQGANDGKFSAVETAPETLVARWIEKGLDRLHVIDVDGIRRGSAANPAIVEQIVTAAGNTAVQLRGGLRDEETVQQYLELGVQYIVLGTRAVSAPHFVKDLCIEYPRHILVGLDIHDGKIAVDGWSKLSNHDVHDLVGKFQDDGVDGIVYATVDKDGSIQDVDSEAVNKLATDVAIPIYATSTARDTDSIKTFCHENADELGGVIMVNAAHEVFASEDFGNLA